MQPFLCWMEKHRDVVVHSDSESDYFVAMHPKKYMQVFYSPNTFFGQTLSADVTVEAERKRVSDATAFQELKKLQDMAVKYNIPLSGVRLVFSGPEGSGGSGGTPRDDVDAMLRGEARESKAGSLLTRVLVEDIWSLDHEGFLASLTADKAWGE